MCSVLLAGMLTSAVSSNNQTKAANRNMQSMQTSKENAFREGIKRQDGYADEAGQDFGDNTNKQGANSFNDDLLANTNNRMKAFGDTRAETGNYAMPASATGNVATNQERVFKSVDEKVTRDNKGLATLGGYGDTQFNNGLAGNAYSRAFGNLSDKAGRDRALIGLDMTSAANNAYKAPNSGVALAKQLGQIAVMVSSAVVGGPMGAAAGAGGGAFTSAADANSKTALAAQTNQRANNSNITMGSYDPNLRWKPKQSAFGGYQS